LTHRPLTQSRKGAKEIIEIKAAGTRRAARLSTGRA
jgi:hypothetical protein